MNLDNNSTHKTIKILRNNTQLKYTIRDKHDYATYISYRYIKNKFKTNEGSKDIKECLDISEKYAQKREEYLAAKIQPNTTPFTV